MNDNTIELESIIFAWLLEVFSNINILGIGNHFADFAEIVGETLELEGHNFRDSNELGRFGSIGLLLTFFAVILVNSFQFVGTEEAGDSFHQAVRSLALLILFI